MNLEELTYRQAELDEIYHLRFAVLRPGHAVVKVYFPEDDAAAPAAWHFGAFDGEAKNVGCLTLLASTWEGAPAIQLRGMAVAAEWCGHGVGRRLLAEAEKVLQKDARVAGWKWWCNARVEAVGFYERAGWKVVSEEFVIEGVGPHRKMLRSI